MKVFYAFLLSLIYTDAYSQIAAGPMLGPVTHRSAGVWTLVENNANNITLRYWQEASPEKKTILKTYEPDCLHKREWDKGIRRWYISDLAPGTVYEFDVQLSSKTIANTTGSFKTQQLFQWRQKAPDFSFITGSCRYVNEPEFDRLGKPYGGDSSIFITMSKEKADFMLWLGDNWYTRDVDYNSESGLWYRALHDRKSPVIQPLWKAMPHIAIWDDHDYGPNDYGSSYIFKNVSRDVFSAFWMNPTYGEKEEGVYTRYQYNDVDYFLMDDRWWRSFDDLPDSVNGKPNIEKQMLGIKQLNWLKNELRYSNKNPFINFKIIVLGSQVLNPASPFDKFLDFSAEYWHLIEFIKNEKINGVVFLTGDRHHSEIIKVKYPGMYPLYDITSSPLTSGTHKFGNQEKENPWRVLGVDQLQNYTRIYVQGEQQNRKLKIVYKGVKGDVLDSLEITANEISYPEE